MHDKDFIWSDIVSKVSRCSKCQLHKYRNKPVPGEGPLSSKLLFIGEAPGQKEDEEGRPFVGSAGKLLTEMLEGRGIARSDVFITNVVRCRPPNNREPSDDEITACGEYTTSIIKLVNPKLLVTLGNHAGRFIFGLVGIKWAGVSRMRGRWVKVDLLGLKDVYLFPTFHPATALYNPNVKSILDLDFDIIKDLYVGLSKESVGRRSPSLLDFIQGGTH
ncbi:MAG: uracil-DNA glycosylase [Sulfolobales archaeon]|nr:uracil-DNA glycosylase [Sulfolobales archaeon]MCX8186240.1 uracil-DNA glycosylase [Sulfolobales archaeon]MDW7969024.1 uracil-DNA glycosylase [Sulfolobales archaeon]